MNHCAVCGLRIRRAEEADRPWLHDDPAYDPFKPPIHAPRPADQEGPEHVATGSCVATCEVEGQAVPCELEIEHSYEHEGNADIVAGPDGTETPFLVWWDDGGHAFVGSDKAVNTGRIA